jgi:hypothetical protein
MDRIVSGSLSNKFVNTMQNKSGAKKKHIKSISDLQSVPGCIEKKLKITFVYIIEQLLWTRYVQIWQDLNTKERE